MRKFMYLLMASVLAALAFAGSAAALSDAEYKKMMKDSPAFAKADKELTQAWNEAKKGLGKSDFDKLKKEQQTWIASGRDKRAKALMKDGMSRAEAYAAATRERVGAIREKLKGGGSTAGARKDARHDAYMKAARAFVEDHKLPDGKDIMPEDVTEDFAENQLAFCDVDGDGALELLINFQTGTMASMLLYACGFDEKAGRLTVKYVGSPSTDFFDNGTAQSPALHNQGLAPDFWPYAIQKYNPKKGEYEFMGNVGAWSEEDFPEDFDGKPFPKEIDKTGDGMVYFIDDDHFRDAKGTETPVDTPVYEAWVAHYTGGAKTIEISWVSADAKGLKALEKR